MFIISDTELLQLCQALVMLFWRFLSNSCSGPTLLLNYYGRRTQPWYESYTLARFWGNSSTLPEVPPSSSFFLAHSSCLMSYATRLIATATEMKACSHISSMIFLPITIHLCICSPFLPSQSESMLMLTYTRRTQGTPYPWWPTAACHVILPNRKGFCAVDPPMPYKSLSLKMVLPSHWRV